MIVPAAGVRTFTRPCAIAPDVAPGTVMIVLASLIVAPVAVPADSNVEPVTTKRVPSAVAPFLAS